jgi:hypothetical protein
MLKLKKLNQRGFDHIMVAVVSFVLVGVVGTALLVSSHAATPATPQWTGVLKAYSSNATLGAGYCVATVSSGNSPSGSEGAYAVLQPCSKTYDAEQIWSLNDSRTITVSGEGTSVTNVQEFTLQSAAGSNQCLNDWQTATANNTQMRLYPCSSSTTANAWIWGAKISGSESYAAHQLLNLGASKISLTGTVSSTSNPMCLDDFEGGHANARVDVYGCKLPAQSPSNQEWYEEPAPTKSTAVGSSSTLTGALQNGNTSQKLCMNDSNSSTTSGTPIAIYACENVVSEKWTITKNSSGQFDLKNGQGVCADPTGTGATEAVQTNTCSSSDMFEWVGHQIEDVTTKTCINDPSSSTKNGTQLTVTSCSGDPASEQWNEVVQ